MVREALMFGMWSLGHYFLNPPSLAVWDNSYKSMGLVKHGWFFMDGASAGCHYHMEWWRS